LRSLAKTGLEKIDDIAAEAVRLAASRLGREITEEELRRESRQLALSLPGIAFRSALRNFVLRPARSDSTDTLMPLALDNLSLPDLKKLVEPSCKSLGISLLRDGPRRIGGKLVQWTELVPRGAVSGRVKAELLQNTVGYVCLSHMDDVLAWLIQHEK
jgi:hypothetical protein